MSETIESPGAACLTDLPNELLMQIISFLPRNGNCLAPLCRVCRIFQTVVQPYLYSTITLTIDWDEKIPDSGALSSGCGNSGVPQFFRLVDTLSKNPTLRTYPRELRLKSDGEAVYHPSLGLQLQLLELLPSLQDLGLSPPPVFSEFPSMPSLRSLQLQFLPDIVHLPHNNFENYDLRHDTQSAEFRTLKNCLLIPTLQVLKIVGLELFRLRLTPLIAFPNLGHRSSTITDLQIACCDVTPAVFAGILLSIRELKHLVLECTYYSSYHSLGKALEPHRGHLEELIIASSLVSSDWIEPLIGSLVDCTALKRLAITEYFLAAHDGMTMQRAIESLPRQLEELQLQHRTKDKTEMALYMDMRVLRYQSLAANKDTSLPALKRVVWWYQLLSEFATEEVYCSDGMKALHPRFQDGGVDFQWGWSDNYWSTPLGKPFKDGESIHGWRTEHPRRS